jgi:hypothetical protein
MHYDVLIIVIEAEEGSEDDFISVIDCWTYDDEGEEIDADAATQWVVGIHTCKDQGEDIDPTLRPQVEAALAAHGITYQELEFRQE